MDFPTFATQAAELEGLSDTPAIRDETTALFTEILDNNSDDETAAETIAITGRFIQGDIFPGWEQTKLDIGPKFVYEAIARCAGEQVTPDDVEEKVAFVDEIGDVAASYDFGEQQNLLAFTEAAEDDLTLTEVYNELERLAKTTGTGSQKQKTDILFGLLNRCSPEEARYLTQLVLSEFHIGISEQDVRAALADTLDVSPASLDIAMQVANDYKEVVSTAQDGGEAALQTMSVELGRPIQPMDSNPGTIRESVQDWQQVAVEAKYNGARAQVHYDGKETIRIFSQNMVDVTSALPDVVQYIRNNVNTPVILDGEVVALDENGNTRPFQNVLRRFNQEESVQALRNQFPVTYYPFDCLYYDGDELLDEPVTERYEKLWKAYPHENVSRQKTYSSTDGIAEFESDVLEDGHEGIMVKDPSSTYEPGVRSDSWRKVKPDVETLEVAITGAEWSDGNSDRMDSFLLGVRTERGFKTIGKIDKGISEDELELLTEKLQPYIRSETGKAIDIQPSVVVEVGYEQIQESPKYTAQYALRFPRFIGVREDKDVDDTDSLERVKELAEMHSQEQEESEGDSRERVAVPDEESDSVKVMEMGDEDVNVVEREESEAGDDDDDDDDDDSSERIYAG